MSGFALGVIHSFDPDHVAAMATLLAREGGSPARAFAKGATWGVGHTLSLAALGLLLVLMNAQLSASWERAFEAAAGLLLVYLGARRLHAALRKAHAQHSHAPLWIGMLHGFAGTAALMALLPAVFIADSASYLAYVLIFGFGSTLSMGAFCVGVDRLVLGVPDPRRRANRWWPALAGTVSLMLGVLWLGRVSLA